MSVDGWRVGEDFGGGFGVFEAVASGDANDGVGGFEEFLFGEFFEGGDWEGGGWFDEHRFFFGKELLGMEDFVVGDFEEDAFGFVDGVEDFVAVKGVGDGDGGADCVDARDGGVFFLFGFEGLVNGVGAGGLDGDDFWEFVDEAEEV